MRPAPENPSDPTKDERVIAALQVAHSKLEAFINAAIGKAATGERIVAAVLVAHDKLGEEFSVFRDTASAEMEAAHDRIEALLLENIELRAEKIECATTIFELRLASLVERKPMVEPNPREVVM